MLNIIEKRFIANLLSVFLILATCISFESLRHMFMDTAPNPVEKAFVNVPIVELSTPDFQQPISKNEPVVSIMSNKAKSQKPVQMIQNAVNNEATHLTAEVEIIQYEVTASSLNIRSNPQATSQILKVVNKGALLEALHTTASGWLALKGGGYVNGKYTKISNGSLKQAAEVEILNKKESAPLKPSSIIKSDSGLFEANIKEIFDGTSLAGLGLEKDILEIEANYGVNAYFTIAVMKLESANGKSRIAKDKNNLFGLNAVDGNKQNKAFSFKTKGDSVQRFGQLISKHYIDKGYTTVEKVSVKYCKANPKWSGLVKTIMNNDYRKL